MASYDPRALLNPKSKGKEKIAKRPPNYGTSPHRQRSRCAFHLPFRPFWELVQVT